MDFNIQYLSIGRNYYKNLYILTEIQVGDVKNILELLQALEKYLLKYQGIIEACRLEGTSKGHTVLPPILSMSGESRFLRAVSSWVSTVSKDRHSTATLRNLLLYFPALQ